jgi:hypothetical protein
MRWARRTVRAEARLLPWCGAIPFRCSRLRLARLQHPLIGDTQCADRRLQSRDRGAGVQQDDHDQRSGDYRSHFAPLALRIALGEKTPENREGSVGGAAGATTPCGPRLRWRAKGAREKQCRKLNTAPRWQKPRCMRSGRDYPFNRADNPAGRCRPDDLQQDQAHVQDAHILSFLVPRGRAIPAARKASRLPEKHPSPKNRVRTTAAITTR